MVLRLPCFTLGWWLLPMLLVGLVALHVATIGRQSFFIDEICELTIAGKPAAEIVCEADSMPPLYALLNKAWLTLLGRDMAARWLSATVSLFTVVVVWRIATEELGAAAGRVAAVLAGTSPFVLYYAQFVRGYALYTLLFALALWFFLRARRNDRWTDWACFVLAAVAGCYTHYYFPLFLLPSIVVLAVERRVIRLGRRAVVAYTAIAVLVLPVVTLLQGDLQFQKEIRAARPLTTAALAYTYTSLLSGYCLGPSKAELHQVSTSQAALQMLPWAVMLGICAGTLAAHGYQFLRRQRLLIPLLLFLFLPVALAGLLGQLLDLTYNVRFVGPCVVPLILWLAAGVSCGWQRWSVRAATALLLVLAAMAFYNRQFVEPYQNEDVRAAATYLAADAETSDSCNCNCSEPIFVVSDYMSDVLQYYLRPASLVRALPNPDEVSVQIRTKSDVQQAIAVIQKETAPGQTYWLLYSRPFHGDPQARLLKYLQQRRLVELVFESAGVRLYRGRNEDLAAGTTTHSAASVEAITVLAVRPIVPIQTMHHFPSWCPAQPALRTHPQFPPARSA